MIVIYLIKSSNRSSSFEEFSPASAAGEKIAGDHGEDYDRQHDRPQRWAERPS